MNNSSSPSRDRGDQDEFTSNEFSDMDEHLMEDKNRTIFHTKQENKSLLQRVKNSSSQNVDKVFNSSNVERKGRLTLNFQSSPDQRTDKQSSTEKTPIMNQKSLLKLNVKKSGDTNRKKKGKTVRFME